MQLPHPKIGQWYKLESGELFEVVAIDEHDRTIEIQHYDGSLDEYDFNSWAISEIRESHPPEDTAGAFDTYSDDASLDKESMLSNYLGNQLDGFN